MEMKAKIFFDVCRLFFDFFSLSLDVSAGFNGSPVVRD